MNLLARSVLAISVIVSPFGSATAADNPPFPRTPEVYKARQYPLMPAQVAVLIETAAAAIYPGDLLGIFHAASVCDKANGSAYQSLAKEFGNQIEINTAQIKDEVVRHYKNLEIISNAKAVIGNVATNCGSLPKIAQGIWVNETPLGRRMTIAELAGYYMDLRRFLGDDASSKIELIKETGEAEKIIRQNAPILTVIEKAVPDLVMPPRSPPLSVTEATAEGAKILASHEIEQGILGDCVQGMFKNNLEPALNNNAQAKPKTFRYFKAIPREDANGRKIVGLLAVYQEAQSAERWEYHGRKTGDGVIDPKTYYDICWIDKAAKSIKAYSYYIRYDTRTAPLVDYVLMGR